MQTCIVKVRKDGLLAPPKEVREQLRHRVGDDLEIVMRPRRTKTPLEEVREKLNHIVTPEEGKRWLHAPLTMFNGRRPIDLIKNGEAERIIQLLVRLEEGIHF